MRAGKPPVHCVALDDRDRLAVAIWAESGRPEAETCDTLATPPCAVADVPAPPATGRGSHNDMYYMQHNAPPLRAGEWDAFVARNA